jgi:hypothetical protein
MAILSSLGRHRECVLLSRSLWEELMEKRTIERNAFHFKSMMSLCKKMKPASPAFIGRNVPMTFLEFHSPVSAADFAK